MMRENAEALLAVSGALHFLQIPSMAYLNRGALRLGSDLERLSALNARIVRLFVGAVMILLLGLGASAALQTDQWLTTPLGRYLSFMLGGFWFARATAQAWLFRVWPRGRSHLGLYFGLFGLYAFLAASYLAVGAAFPVSASATQRTPVPTCPSRLSKGWRCQVRAWVGAKSQLPPRRTPRSPTPRTRGSTGAETV